MGGDTANDNRISFLKRRTIASDLTIGIALTIIAVTSVLSLLEYNVSLSRAERRLERQAEDMADKLVTALLLPLWNVNHHAVRMVAEAYAQTQNVVGLRIVDDTGAVIFEERVPGEQELIRVSREVLYRQQDIGLIEVTLSTRNILEAQRQALVFTIAVMACVTLAVVAVIRILLKVFLRQPLTDLTQGLKTIASGAYAHHLPSVKQQDVDAIITDVNAMATQIHERENDLRESKKRYEELANLLPETVYETDTQGRFTFMSRSGFAAFGLTDEDLDSGLSVLDLFIEEDRGRVRDDMERIKAGEPVGATEYTARRKDGSRFPVLVHSSAVVRGEKAEGLRAIAVDITDRKRLEEELARLASGIAHQVRNPVMTIGGFALRLQKQYATDEDPHNWLQIILLEVQRLERMVADIHELTGLREAEPRSVSPKELLEAFIAEFRQRPELGGIRLKTTLPDALPRVTVDQGLIFMAFEKIMENAVDAMPEGGELEVRAYEEGGQVCVRFADEGVGIAEQDLPHVCEPFYGSKPQASGLGLTVVQRILLEHRGRLVIESAVDQGTSVEVCLPPALLETS